MYFFFFKKNRILGENVEVVIGEWKQLTQLVKECSEQLLLKEAAFENVKIKALVFLSEFMSNELFCSLLMSF